MANSLLQDFDLTYIRNEAKTAMPDLVQIQRRTMTSDKQGGYTSEYANVYENVPARLMSETGTESVEEGRHVLQSKHTLTVAYSQSVDQTDRVIHSSGTYEVFFVDVGDSWATAKQCQLRKI